MVRTGTVVLMARNVHLDIAKMDTVLVKMISLKVYLETIVPFGPSVEVDVMLTFLLSIKRQEKSKTIAKFPVKTAWCSELQLLQKIAQSV